MISHSNIVVKINKAIANDLKIKTQPNWSYQLFQMTLEKYGLHFPEEDWNLENEANDFLYVSIPSSTSVTPLITDLMQLPFVDAAYLKPASELPLNHF